MTKKRFEIIESAIIDGAKVIKDNEKKYVFPSTFETLFNYRKALNELDDRYIDEFSLRETLQQDLQRVEYENEQLRAKNEGLEKDLQETMNIFNELNALVDENEQLKSELEEVVEVCRKYGIYKEELQYVLADYDKMLNENGERAIRYKYCANSR